MRVFFIIRLVSYSVLLVGCVVAAGCASITSGTEQVVYVETPGCRGATCKLSNNKGVWSVNSTPGAVTVHRAYGRLSVVCSHPDLKAVPAQNSVSSKTKGAAYGNILLGGIIGAGVDIQTGAAYDYPQSVQIPMDCDTSSVVAANNRATGYDRRASGMPVSESSTTGANTLVDGHCAALEERLAVANGVPLSREILKARYTDECPRQGQHSDIQAVQKDSRTQPPFGAGSECVELKKRMDSGTEPKLSLEIVTLNYQQNCRNESSANPASVFVSDEELVDQSKSNTEAPSEPTYELIKKCAELEQSIQDAREDTEKPFLLALLERRYNQACDIKVLNYKN